MVCRAISIATRERRASEIESSDRSGSHLINGRFVVAVTVAASESKAAFGDGLLFGSYLNPQRGGS